MKKVSILLVMVFLLCGCVKNDISMRINKNKSMEVSFNIVTDKNNSEEVKQIQDKLKIFTDKIDAFKEKSIYLSEYTDADYYGITITKKIKNIDEVSNKIDVENNLYNLFNDNAKTQYYFTLDKDFLKNDYKMKLYADKNELSAYFATIKNEFELEDIVEIIDFSNVKFSLRLPYAAINSNADIVASDKLTLTWNLNSDKTLEAEFELYNQNHVRALQFLVVAICLMFISTFFNDNNKKKKKEKVDINEEIKKEENTEDITINKSEYSI